ncbi:MULTISPECIES: hypothetical protein [Sphingobacterium]|uniref:hypothetical protein n=1 Tax=Sphingobacterium TaxID=28453 RepID=UPI000389E406|nr:hypothetical protein [Sphingobacterium sp. IITKGP-BTPF85]KKX46778.1 hypothetical protein L950_0230055 [Sphingobacterium sp. IITKGP-BTPF85]
MSWFPFTGSDPSDPTHYSSPVPTQPSCPGATQQICALQASADSNNEPIITDALKNEIINSLQNQVNGTNVKLKAR